MLEEVYKNYRRLADEIDWKKYNQNELVFEYIKHEHDPLKENFYAGIVCRWWGYSGKVFRACNKHVPFDQCYDVLIDAINYILEKRVWENPDSSLYGDPTAPDKAFHIALRRQQGILLSSYTAQKRQSNFNTLSIDEMYENYSDSTEGLFNMVDESSAPTDKDEELVDFINSFSHPIQKIILDIICFTRWNTLPGVITKMRKLSIEDFEYYNTVYHITKEEYLAYLCKLARTPNITVMGWVQTLLREIKENLYE